MCRRASIRKHNQQEFGDDSAAAAAAANTHDWRAAGAHKSRDRRNLLPDIRASTWRWSCYGIQVPRRPVRVVSRDLPHNDRLSTSASIRSRPLRVLHVHPRGGSHQQRLGSCICSLVGPLGYQVWTCRMHCRDGSPGRGAI